MHILPQLRKLEQKYAGEMVVIGVHAGKFLAERQTENIRQAVLRLEIDHPVVNDRYFRTWREYTVNAWPTLALVDPEGRLINLYPGETTFEAFDPIIQSLVDEFHSKGTLDRRPMTFRPERLSEPARPLAFPGKLIVDASRHLYVADSNHNRIVVARVDDDALHARVEAIIGSGSAGLADGDFKTAAFNRPQGLALDGDTVYVADTQNHALRAVDLRKHLVTTFAGTGVQARYGTAGGRAIETPLSSPWDVLLQGRVLYIAMAGSHQLWRLDLATWQIHPHAGSGFEEITDGPLSSAALAQPSGLASNGQKLFFADSESSAIRWADLGFAGETRTIVGKGLFEFGDKDGVGIEARLQHPLSIAWHDGLLHIADTYNNKIKVVDPNTRRATTLLGTGEAGLQDGDEPQFYEPGGICASNGRLYIADTNNHAIRVADLRTRRVWTVVLDLLT
ncbi:MAG: alkyl hydroperoxide reductase [Chloroflexi bacterium]|nr:alkyl hydroperoxide reductase [Chloroflexota bacterium]